MNVVAIPVKGQLGLADLARRIQQRTGPLPRSYVLGKTALRDQVMDTLDCSAMRAEGLVERLIREGFVGFARERRGLAARSGWWFA